MGVCNACTQQLKDYKQGKRKQYGIKHYVSATIHAAMGDTLNQMPTSISMNKILSRTKYAKDSIFVG